MDTGSREADSCFPDTFLEDLSLGSGNSDQSFLTCWNTSEVCTCMCACVCTCAWAYDRVEKREKKLAWSKGILYSRSQFIEQPDEEGVVAKGRVTSRGENTRAFDSAPRRPYSNVSVLPRMLVFNYYVYLRKINNMYLLTYLHAHVLTQGHP